MAAGYVANWGNDLNNGLTWATAKKSLQGAKDITLSPISIKGLHNIITGDFGYPITGTCIVEAIGQVTPAGFPSSTNIVYKNIPIFNNSSFVGTFTNCVFQNIGRWGNQDGSYGRVLNMHKCTVINSAALMYRLPTTSNYGFATFNQCTIFGDMQIALDAQIENAKSIFVNGLCLISAVIPSKIKFCLFVNKQFKFTGGGRGTDETAYSYPTGATDTDKLQNLRSRMATVYGGSANDYLIGCKYYSGSYNDIFVDADNDNFYLKNTPGNPALNLSYEGGYVGAKPPAAGSFAIATASARTNIAADGLVTNQAQNAQAEWNTIDIGRVTEITSLDAMANLAYRNGLALNTDAYVGAPITAGTNKLTAGKQYQVIDANATGGSIVLNNAGATVLTAFKTFTAVDEGGGAGLGFSSVDNLTCREIDINQFDEKVELLCSRTDATLATAAAIKLKLYEMPMVNVNANSEPTHGNGNTGYNAVTAVKLFTRFVKVKAYIQANQLYAR